MNTLTASLACWFALFAQLQPPPPTPSKAAQKQEQNSRTKGQTRASRDSPAKLDPATAIQGNPKPNATEGNEQSGQSKEEPPEYWWDDPTTVFTSILAVAAVIQLLIYGTQAWYMYRGLKATEAMVKQMRLEQRAWLAAKPSLEPLVPNQAPVCEFLLTNSGRTPATIEKCIVSMTVALVPTDLDGIVSRHAAKAEDLPREMVIAPNGTSRIVIGAEVFDEEEVDAITDKGTKTLVLTATVTYMTAMKRRGETRACYLYDIRNDALVMHEQHNYMR